MTKVTSILAPNYENSITEQELKDGEHIVNMTMGALLPLLEEQNAIL